MLSFDAKHVLPRLGDIVLCERTGQKGTTLETVYRSDWNERCVPVLLHHDNDNEIGRGVVRIRVKSLLVIERREDRDRS